MWPPNNPLAALLGESEPETLPSIPLGGVADAPQTPMGMQPPPMAPPPNLSQHHSAADFVRQLAPMLMSIVAGRKDPMLGAAMLHGHVAGLQLARQEQMQAQARAADQVKLRTAFMQHVLSDVRTLKDPVDQQRYLALAHDVGKQMGLPDQWTTNLPIPRASETDRLKTEITSQLAAFDKDARWKTVAGTPQEAKISFRLSNGQSMSVSSARRLLNQQFMDEQGNAAYAPAPPEKPEKVEKKAYQHVEALVAGRRRFVNFDPGTGKYFDPQSGAEVQATPAPSKTAGDGFGGPGSTAGGLDDDGLEYAATLFRLTQQMPALGMGKNPDRGRIINRAAAQARSLGQTPAAAIQRTSLYKADGKALDRISLLASTAQAAESKASAQIDIIRALSRKVDRTRFPVLNRAILAGQTSIAGDPDATALLNAISTFAAEYGKIIEASTGSVSGSSDSSRAAAGKLINAAMTPAQLDRVLTLMQREMGLTLQGYDVTRTEITKRMGGQPQTSAPTAPGGTPAVPATPLGNGAYQSGRFRVQTGGGQ